MKKVYAILVLGLCLAQAQAQKIIEKQVTLGPNASVKLNLQIADSITVITWDKNEAYIKGSVNVNDNKDNDNYTVAFSGSDLVFNVTTKLEYPRSTNGKNCNCSCTTNIKFVVYIPANADLSVETINGNIIIRGKTAAVRAHSISGFVDMAVSPERKAIVKMSTITGNMYSDLDLHSEDKNLSKVGGNIHTELNGGGDKSIDLETISGDIFFRKAKEG